MSEMDPYDHPPDLDLLIACGARVAQAMGQREPDENRTRMFFDELLHKQGGKNVWGCLTVGIITEVETRHVVMANFATWLSDENGEHEPSCDTWNSPDLERLFDLAILGRPAKPDGF